MATLETQRVLLDQKYDELQSKMDAEDQRHQDIMDDLYAERAVLNDMNTELLTLEKQI